MRELTPAPSHDEGLNGASATRLPSWLLSISGRARCGLDTAWCASDAPSLELVTAQCAYLRVRLDHECDWPGRVQRERPWRRRNSRLWHNGSRRKHRHGRAGDKRQRRGSRQQRACERRSFRSWRSAHERRHLRSRRSLKRERSFRRGWRYDRRNVDRWQWW